MRNSLGLDLHDTMGTNNAANDSVLTALSELFDRGGSHFFPNGTSDHGMDHAYYSPDGAMFGFSNDTDNLSYTHKQNSTMDEDSASYFHMKMLHILDFWINAVVTNIVVILGMIGNIMTIVILSQRAMRSSTNYYLSALAIWDSMVLICTMLLIGLVSVPGMDSYKTQAHPYIVAYGYPMALTAQTATIWLTVSFTVERYIAVCHPLKAASMCTIARAKIVIFGVSFGSTLYNMPRWFDYYPRQITHPDTQLTSIILAKTNFSQNPMYVKVYLAGLYVPMMCVVPLLVLAVMNIFLILAVRQSRRQRMDMNVRQSRENNVTIMLVAVVIVFIICQVPALVYNLAYAIDLTYVEQNFGYQVLSFLRNFLVTLNSAINFLLYCALGQKFRRIFLHTFCKRCAKDQYIPMSGVHHTTVVTMPSQRRHFCLHTTPTAGHRQEWECNKLKSADHSHRGATNGPWSAETSSGVGGSVGGSGGGGGAGGGAGSSGYKSYTATPTPAAGNNAKHTPSAADAEFWAKDKWKRRQQSKDKVLEDENGYSVTLEHLLPDQPQNSYTAVYKPTTAGRAGSRSPMS